MSSDETLPAPQNSSALAPEPHHDGSQPPPYNKDTKPAPHPYQHAIDRHQALPPPTTGGVSFMQHEAVYDSTHITGIYIQFQQRSRDVYKDVKQVLETARHPVWIICPYCNYEGFTVTEYTPGLLTWGMCVGLALVGCILGCCLFPFCFNKCQDCEHICSSCNRPIHVNKVLWWHAPHYKHR